MTQSAPTISSISVSSGYKGETTTVTLTGTYFFSTGVNDVASVMFGTTVVPAAYYTVTSNTSITCTVPTYLPAGAYHIYVTNSVAKSSGTSADLFTIVAVPTIKTDPNNRFGDFLDINGHPTQVKLATAYSHTFTATATGAAQDLTANPKKDWSLQCTTVGGTVTTWTVNLQVSLDGVNYTTILAHTNSTGTGVVTCTTSAVPALYYRVDATLALGTGTGLLVNVAGM